MTYVREQTSAELAAHIRSLKKMAGWFDPLSDRLWQEVEALQAEVSGLKTGYEAYERGNAELKAESEALRKDAERYRRMRAMTLAQMDDTPDEFDSGFDSQLDAAMGKGEQS